MIISHKNLKTKRFTLADLNDIMHDVILDIYEIRKKMEE